MIDYETLGEELIRAAAAISLMREPPDLTDLFRDLSEAYVQALAQYEPGPLVRRACKIHHMRSSKDPHWILERQHLVAALAKAGHDLLRSEGRPMWAAPAIYRALWAINAHARRDVVRAFGDRVDALRDSAIRDLQRRLRA